MKHPLWTVIDHYLRELAKNGDIRVTTARGYVIGFICQAVHESLTKMP